MLSSRGGPAGPALAVRPLPVGDIAPGLVVQGPVPGLAEQVRDLHRRFHGQRQPRLPGEP